jgi:hypothetical protein
MARFAPNSCGANPAPLIDEEIPMDQKQRIELLKAEARRLSGGKMQSSCSDGLPDDLAEQFWKRVIAFETAPTTTEFVRLTADGVDLPQPEDVSDQEIGRVLWTVIRALNRHRVVLSRTDHLSDRELYAALWHHVMREEITVRPDDADAAWHVDMPGDDANATNYLTYYATEQEREWWRRDGPDSIIPPHQDPPFARAARLAQLYDNADDLTREYVSTRKHQSAATTCSRVRLRQLQEGTHQEA